MSPPLHLALVWHMHQPFYKDLVADEYILPWVRLHGTKDYLDMVKVLEPYPNVRQTFNLVPSLLGQIEDYATGTARDRYMVLTLKAPDELDTGERVELLSTFFNANPATMVAPHPRYADLLQKRGNDTSEEALARVARYFTDQDLLDLQVWFNLAWCDPMFLRDEPVLKGLVDKGRDYDADDKANLMACHQQLMGQIVPAYRQAAERGQVELTTTPFYHPILPLVCDSEVARESLPNHALPTRFQHPEDARTQIQRAVDYHTRLFGQAPKGMWPSEGSVSEAMLPLVAEAGIRWIATDEEVLRESQRLHAPTGGDHFRPYRLERNGVDLSILFRDHRLSDRIGFVYSGWDPQAAADDFRNALHQIRHNLKGSDRAPLVTVILDGENCWEHYPGDGHDFLNALYGGLEQDRDIVCTTVSDYLAEQPAQDHITRLFAGSWINHDFEIWIGREEDNLAWERLRETRELLTGIADDPGELPAEQLRLAWESLYIAEGSDWCWWYGGQHVGMLAEFDALFRQHLINIHTLLEQPVPEILHVPILRHAKAVSPTHEEHGFIHPQIDGRVGSYFEWLGAGKLEGVAGSGGAMHAVGHALTRLVYGFDENHLYLRLDPDPEDAAGLFSGQGGTVLVSFLAPAVYQFRLSGGVDCEVELQRADGDDQWVGRPFSGQAATGEVIELAIPYMDLGWVAGDEVHLFVRVFKDDQAVERWPAQGYLAVTVPDADYQARQWVV